MFYVSSKQGDTLWITDTADDVTERYTIEEITKIIREYKINVFGLIYSGSKYKARVTSPGLVHLETIGNGTVFILDGKPAMMVSREFNAFTIFDGNHQVKVLDKDLIARKHKVKIGVSDELHDKIQTAFCKKYSASPLCIYLDK